MAQSQISCDASAMVKPGKFEQNLETDLTILHPSEALSGQIF